MHFDRVDKIRAWRLCLGCGACVAVCPENNIKLVDIPQRGLRPVLKNDKCRHCESCVKVCPGIGLEHDFSEDIPVLNEWGPVLEVWEGYAADPRIRFCGSSGGAATAIAWYCLNEASGAGVLHTGAISSNPLRNDTIFSRTYEQLIACSGSRYSPAGPCEGLKQIRNAAAPCVFIGKPCDVAALRKYETIFPEVKQKIMAAISIFCAGTPSTEGTLRVLEKMNISKDRLSSFRYRGCGWPGNAVAQSLDNSEKRVMTYQQCWGEILSRYVAFRCRLCPDSTGEFADISCGDPWYRTIEPDDPGRSLVIARTDRGADIIRRAIKSRYLILETAHPKIVALSQKSLLNKRRHLYARLKTMSILGVPVPEYSGFDLNSSWKMLPFLERIKSITGTLRRIVKRKWRRPDPEEVSNPS